MDYRERLKQFNSTEKYLEECIFLDNMLQIQSNDVVLDYGCGLGTMVKRLIGRCVGVFGYDITDWDGNEPNYLVNEIKYKFTKIYFMHSFAHIPNPKDVLNKLSNHLVGDSQIHILTPNKDYLDTLPKNPNYKPDPTVFKHYNSKELIKLFKSCGYEPKIKGQLGDRNGEHLERLYMMFTLKK